MFTSAQCVPPSDAYVQTSQPIPCFASMSGVTPASPVVLLPTGKHVKLTNLSF